MIAPEWKLECHSVSCTKEIKMRGKKKEKMKMCTIQQLVAKVIMHDATYFSPTIY